MSDGQLVEAAWPGCGGQIVAGATTRHGEGRTGRYAHFNLALHTGDDPQQVQQQRSQFQRLIRAGQVQWLNQVHGTDCFEADAQTVAEAPTADAVWTAQQELALAILTADCVPVLLWHPQTQLVGAAHAGWQGLLAGTLQALLAAMPASASGLQAWIGPAISQSCYEVGEEVWQPFHRQFPHRVVFSGQLAATKGLLDLPGVAEDILRSAGLRRIFNSGWCSYADPRFYSHRRTTHQGGGETGRMASYIMLTA